MAYSHTIGEYLSYGVLLLLSASLLTGCTTFMGPAQAGSPIETSRRCIPNMTSRMRAASNVPAHTRIQPTTLASITFGPDALRVADIVGVVAALNELAEESASPHQQPPKILLSRQRLTEQVLLALFEVTSSTAELTCERDITDQIADRIDEIDNARVKRLTIASIVFGGIAGIISGGVGLAAGAAIAGNAADVGGGVLASWFGVSALFTHSETEFRHERNALEEVWIDSDPPKVFSPIVWRFLHQADGSKTKSPRDQIITAWRQEGRLGEPGSTEEHRRQALFFGLGGQYGATELRARASMLETLEASIRLLHEELEVLLRVVVEHSFHTVDGNR